MIERLVKEDEETQTKIEEIGKKIKIYSEDDDAESLAKLFKENEKYVPYLLGYIEDAFTSALYRCEKLECNNSNWLN